jgi:hypothetical protein
MLMGSRWTGYQTANRPLYAGRPNTVQINRSEDAPRAIGRPNRDAQRRSFGSEPPNEPPAEETRAAEYADRGHGIAFSMAEKTGICIRRAVERSGDAQHLRPRYGSSLPMQAGSVRPH